jgi:hypothetical protein
MGMHEHEQRAAWLEQIDSVINEYEKRGIGQKYGDFAEFESRALALVQRIAPGTVRRPLSSTAE